MPKPSIKIGQLLGRYRILEKIEGGSQGTVYRAHDERGLERDVALKVLGTDLPGDEAARIQFRREAEALGKLNHPNVAQGFDVGYKEEYGVDFLVTEYIPGSGLDEKVKNGPLPESTVLDLGIQLTKGLEAAHRVGVIHRDLKPGNLRITEEGQLKIIDFGLAKATDPGVEAAIAETITLGKDVVGTLPYMAPEQWLGTSNQRTDVWGAGAVLYEMATGERPFPQVRFERLQEAIQHREPARPIAMNPAVSAGLEGVILRCLQKDPIRRYQTAKELREDLAAVASGEGKALRWLRDNGIGIAAAAVLIAITAFVTNFIDRRRMVPPPPNHFVFAVIPFGTSRTDASKSAFHRGIAETIGARIGEQNSPAALQLIPPSEAIDHGVETAEAAQREFGVNLVLEIGLEETPESLRITGSLVNPVSHQQIGARTVTGDRAKLWELEDQLASKVFEILPTTAQSQPPAPTRVQAAEHPEGYENYERGRGYLLDYHKPENIDNAIAQFNQALSKSPNFAAAYAGLGEAYWRGFRAHRGKAWLELASTNCEKALATDPHMAEAHTCLGNLDNDTGHYDRGADEFNRALAVDKANIQAFRGLGDAYSALGKTTDAEETFKKAIAARPQYWAVYHWLGIFYSGQARYADAAPMFKKVIQLTPDNHRGYYDLGGVLEYEGKYNEGIEALNHSIKLFPTMDAYSNLGAAYFYLRRYSDAISAFEKARALDEQDYLNWGNLGDALYWAPGRRSEATAAYKRAIELAQAQVQVNPRDATARAYVAEYSAMVGEKSTAVEQIQKALALAPMDPDVMFRAGLVYNQLGDKQQTLQWLKKSIDGHYSPTLIRDTPDFAQLQPDPAFKALISAK